MKDLNSLGFEEYPSLLPAMEGVGNLNTCRCFKVYACGSYFRVLADIEKHYSFGWVEHISISPLDRKRKTVPTWKEMCAIKDMFFHDEEECFQYFPKKSEYVNIHSTCMHLWRYIDDPTGRGKKVGETE